MFTDPQSVTVAGSAKSMPRVENEGRKSVYQSADGLFTLTISHQAVKASGKDRVRTLVKISQKAMVTNPLDSTNDYDFIDWQIVNDRPLAGFTATQISDLWAAIKASIDTTFVTKLVGQES